MFSRTCRTSAINISSAGGLGFWYVPGRPATTQDWGILQERMESHLEGLFIQRSGVQGKRPLADDGLLRYAIGVRTGDSKHFALVSWQSTQSTRVSDRAGRVLGRQTKDLEEEYARLSPAGENQLKNQQHSPAILRIPLSGQK